MTDRPAAGIPGRQDDARRRRYCRAGSMTVVQGFVMGDEFLEPTGVCVVLTYGARSFSLFLGKKIDEARELQVQSL
jgi:hypothetical protein